MDRGTAGGFVVVLVVVESNGKILLYIVIYQLTMRRITKMFIHWVCTFDKIPSPIGRIIMNLRSGGSRDSPMARKIFFSARREIAFCMDTTL